MFSNINEERLQNLYKRSSKNIQIKISSDNKITWHNKYLIKYR